MEAFIMEDINFVREPDQVAKMMHELVNKQKK